MLSCWAPNEKKNLRELHVYDDAAIIYAKQ